MRILTTLLGATTMVATLIATPPANAQQQGVAPAYRGELRVGDSEPAPEVDATDEDSEAFLAAAKLGGIYSFNGLGPFLAGGIELGWVFAGTKRSVVVMLDVTYATPKGDDTARDELERVRGDYEWEVTQKELTLQPTLMYRLTALGNVVPYIGVGPRIYLLETTSRGTAGGEEFGQHEERSTKLGVGAPLGAELTLGPGGLFAELLFQWAPIDHRITGESNLAALTMFIGYRALL